jgi:phage terminase large subunit
VDTAQMYILRLMCEPGRNLLCVRKTEESNRASTYAELSAAINRLGVRDLWESTTAPSLQCRLNGNAVMFRGMKDAGQREKLKSITFPGGKLTDVWIEEATELDAADFEIIDDRLRGVLPEGLFYQIKLTFNPVSANHWLKKRFFDRASDDVCTCHSSYLDNRFIDPAFHRRMERRRKQDPEGYRVYGLGEWGVVGGQYFPEWRESVHVRDYEKPPREWRRYVTLDYGLDMLAAYFIAMDREGCAYVYKEVYESGLIVSAAAQKIREATDADEEIYQYFAPPDLWNRRQDTGKSAAAIFAENGVPLSKAVNDRVAGWYDLHEWLRPYEDEQGRTRAALTVYRNCENLIRTLPSLSRDTRNPNDAAVTPHELTHAPDALRYFAAGRPVPAREKERARELVDRFGRGKKRTVI